jgi:DNA replication protein DnaC
MPRLNELLGNSKKLEARSSKLDGNGGVEPRTSSLEDSDRDDGSCPICHGGGFVRRDLPLGHAEFGKALPCRCVENESRETRQSRLQHYSNLGPLTRLTFENLSRLGLSQNPADRARFTRCVEDAEEFAKDPHGWLVMVGASGRGKTHVAAAIANRCVERGTPALFVVVPDLLDHLRATYRPNAEVSYDQLFEQVRNAPVLILDDLGTESETSWAQEKLFQIINHRYNALLPTVVTSNVPLKRLDERLRMRLTDTALARVYELGQRSVLDYQYENALFQPRIRSMTLENFDLGGHGLLEGQRESLRAAHRACLTYAEKPDGWLVLTGGPGCGKTHLAAGIANFRLQHGDLPQFIKVSRLLQVYRSTFDESSELSLSEVTQEVENTPFLVLDDLFFRSSKTWKSDWANEQLFSLIDYRYENRLATVFTSTLTEAGMTSDEIGNRFAARLWDYGISMEVQITAPPYKVRKLVKANLPKRSREDRA